MRSFVRSLIILALALAAQAAQQSHFLKNIVVGPDETVDGDLTVYRGDLVVQGEIVGNVAVMFGDCRIEPGGRVGGDLVVVQGSLQLEDAEAQVGGRISQRDFLAGALSDDVSPFEAPSAGAVDEDGGEEGQAADKEDGMREWEGDDDTDVFLAFNRVSGLQLGLKFRPERARIQKGKWADIVGHAAWAFGQSRPEWDLKLRRRFDLSSGVYLAGGMHRKTDTQDDWMLSRMENSLAGWLLHLDFFDYYDNQGGTVEMGAFAFDGRLQVQAGWFREKYAPLGKTTDWSWSGADRDYRENLYSDALGYSSNTNSGLRASADLQLNRRVEGVRRGLAATINYETSLGGDPVDFDYQRLLGNVRFWLPLGSRQMESLNGRVLAGRVDGDDWPAQYAFRLGGPDALPGWRPKAIDGRADLKSEEMLSYALPDAPGAMGASNMLLLSLENRIRGEVLDFWPLDDLDLLVLADAGAVFGKDWGDLEAGDLKADFGFGIAGNDDDWQLAILRATDSSQADWRLLFRLQPRFQGRNR